MWMSVVPVLLRAGLLLLLLLGPALGCYRCLVDVSTSLTLCWGHVLTRYNIRNVGACFEKLERLFDNNPQVIEAGRVGEEMEPFFVSCCCCCCCCYGREVCAATLLIRYYRAN